MQKQVLVAMIILATQMLFMVPVRADEKTISLPPQSLGQWYKPANKRQVWLHNMFKLRRELQAVSEHLALGDSELQLKWYKRFAEHYRKIGEMVPEWQDELELEWLSRLGVALASHEVDQAEHAMKKLKMSCSGCHREYQAMAAITYRIPDFSKVRVKSGDHEIDYSDHMNELSKLVNRIKIATDDQNQSLALETTRQLSKQMGVLGTSCQQCHKDSESRERILGKNTEVAIDRLKQHLRLGETKKAGRTLGEVAVIACARCHGIHRTVSAVRSLVTGR